MNPASQKENSGLRVNYYLAQVDHPQREEQPPYQAECEDIIDALGLTPDEANIFKEIWRTANERTHGKAKEGNNPLRAAQKLVHYSGRILKKAQRLACDTDAAILKTMSALNAVDALAGHEQVKDPNPNAWIEKLGGSINSKPVNLGDDELIEVLYANTSTLDGPVRAKHVTWINVIRWRRYG